MMNLFFVFMNFHSLIVQCFELLIQLYSFTGGSICNTGLQISNCSAVTSLLFMHIIGTDTGNGVRLIAVHINQALEAVLLAAVKQPVYRAFLINLAVVGVEVIQEVIPNHILRLTLAAQCIGNEFQVFVQRILTIHYFYELHKTTDDVIFKILVIADIQSAIFAGVNLDDDEKMTADQERILKHIVKSFQISENMNGTEEKGV